MSLLSPTKEKVHVFVRVCLSVCIGYGTLQPCLGCQRAALLGGILRRENPTYGVPIERAVVLKWFY